MHLLGIGAPLENRRHLIKTPIQVRRQMKHFNPGKMHEEYNMVRIKSGVSPLTGILLHDKLH